MEKLALDRYDEFYAKTGHPMVSMLRLLEAAAGPESGQYIHLGATTQDIMDSAMTLALRSMFTLTRAKLVSIQSSVLDLCQRHADTPMMGRTHNIQALPINLLAIRPPSGPTSWSAASTGWTRAHSASSPSSSPARWAPWSPSGRMGTPFRKRWPNSWA